MRIECTCKAMILHNRMMQRLLIRILRHCQNWRNIKTLSLPVRDCVSCVEHFNMTHCFLQSLEAKLR